MMNVEDARGKWCPMVQIAASENTAMRPRPILYTNRMDRVSNHLPTCCLADDCALWVDDGYLTGHCGLIRGEK